MPTPLSISAFPVRGYNIAEDVVGVNTFMQSPLVVAGRPSDPWEDYNYKSLAAVAHIPGWNGTPVVGNRGVGQPSQLRIGCVFGLRNGMFCRVLHTQIDEVIDFSLCGETLKICWAFGPWGFDSPSRHHHFNYLAFLFSRSRHVDRSVGCG